MEHSEFNTKDLGIAADSGTPSANAAGFQAMVIVRILVGFSIGVSSGVVPLSPMGLPTEIHGALGSVNQLSICVGILLALIAGLPLVNNFAWHSSCIINDGQTGTQETLDGPVPGLLLPENFASRICAKAVVLSLGVHWVRETDASRVNLQPTLPVLPTRLELDLLYWWIPEVIQQA
ncbi:unnamed protein product [Sphagnum jensenii]|uniref:Major facilitator superfamily (MFS) profile domain-containing protein n=1 Tax=Sphagnum jensenii TaxID=128206 RepID=A0ABP0WXM6_9BRYO